MRTKSTIFYSPYCHIYKDMTHQQTSMPKKYDCEEVLVIEVNYEFVDYGKYEDQSAIVVEWNSDFAVFIRHLISLVDKNEVNAMVREHWLSKNPQFRNK